MLSKNVQFITAGILVLYIVFSTRPAPVAVTTLLASPIAQLVALGLVVYIGSSVSLLVAVLAALAIVLSIPAREYAGKEDDKTMKPSETTEKKKDTKKAPPAPKPTGSKSEKKSDEIAKKDADKIEPEAAADKVVSTEGGKGSEKFSLMNAAPF
jgi:hypothetical protein